MPLAICIPTVAAWTSRRGVWPGNLWTPPWSRNVVEIFVMNLVSLELSEKARLFRVCSNEEKLLLFKVYWRLYTPHQCGEYYRDPYMTQSKAVFLSWLTWDVTCWQKSVMLGLWGMRFMFGRAFISCLDDHVPY